MRATLSRERVTLTSSQLAMALGLAKLSPRARSGLPAPTPAGHRGKGLGGTGVVTPKGALTPVTEATLAVLAHPEWRLSVRVNEAGRPAWTETVLVRAAAPEPLVVVVGDGDGLDATLLPRLADARETVEDLLDVAGYPSGGDQAQELSLVGFAAVLSLADVLQDVALRARLARERPRPPVCSPDMLEEQLERGLATGHTRWAVTAARMVVPDLLAGAVGRMAEGMAELAGAGLVRPEDGAHTLTREGFELADALGRLVGTAGLTVATARGDDAYVTAERVVLFRTATAVWSASLSGAGAAGGQGDAARVVVQPVGSDGVQALLDELVGLAGRPTKAGPDAAREAGAEAGPEATAGEPATASTDTAKKAPAKKAPAKKATATTAATEATAEAATPQQGGASAAARAAATAAMETAIAGWTPTHVVPEGGMPAWAAPDPTSQPIATLGARLPVQVREERGAWAHVLCSNGWRGWVDSRRLVSL